MLPVNKRLISVSLHSVEESDVRDPAQKRHTILHFGTDHSALLERARDLNHMGYEVLNSNNGFEAIQLGCLELVDAVVLDQAGNYAEVEVIAREIKRSRPRVPMILLMERAASQDRLHTQAGAMVTQRNDVSMLAATLHALLNPGPPEPGTVPRTNNQLL